jgi:hypothetical protein
MNYLLVDEASSSIFPMFVVFDLIDHVVYLVLVDVSNIFGYEYGGFSAVVILYVLLLDF